MEVKATGVTNPCRYMMRCAHLERYVKHWPEVLLVVFAIRERTFRVKPVSQLNLSDRETGCLPDGHKSYVLDLYKEFELLEEWYGFDRAKYNQLIADVMAIVTAY